MAETEIANAAPFRLWPLKRLPSYLEDIRIALDRLPEKRMRTARSGCNAGIHPLGDRSPSASGARQRNRNLGFRRLIARDPGESAIGELMVVNLSPLRKKALELEVLYQDRHQQRGVKRLAWRGMFLLEPGKRW